MNTNATAQMVTSGGAGCGRSKPQGGTSEQGADTALRLLLDCVDYKSGNCKQTEMVGAVLPQTVIDTCRAALSRKND